jgi:O-antigen/teichoic acid export membrane protein
MSAHDHRDVDGQRASYRSGFFFGSLSFLVVACVGVVSTIVTARVYGVRIIGEFALVSVPVAVLWVLSSVKEQQALIREIAELPMRHPRVTQLFAVVFTFSIALTVSVSAIAAVVCVPVFRGPLHAPELVQPALVSIAGYALVTNTGWNVDSILSAFVAGREIFWVRLHEVISFLVIALAIGSIWHSIWGLVIATVGASLTSLVHRLIVAHRFVHARLTRQDYRAGFAVLPELLRFGIRAVPGQIAQGISQQGGIWALGMVAPIGVVGAFSRAQTIPQRLQQASMRVSEVLYPTLVGRRAKGDGHGFDRALIDSIRYEGAGMLLIAASIGGTAHLVLQLFGPGFERAAPALAILMVYPALASVTVTQTQALWAVNRPGWTSVIAAARLVVTIALLVILTPSVGIVGPAIALVAGYGAVVALNGALLKPALTRPLRATWPLRERFALLLAYAAGFAVAHAGEQVFTRVIGLPICLAAGALTFLIVLGVCGGVNARDRQRLSELLARARRRRSATPVEAPPVQAPPGDAGLSRPAVPASIHEPEGVSTR